MSNYSSNTFLRPLSQTDKIINIYDENLELKWQILPFTIKNTFIINNLLKISLDSDRVITLDFNSGNEAKVALPILKSQIETLSGETPLRISRIIDNYIESVGTLGPTGSQGIQGETGATGPASSASQFAALGVTSSQGPFSGGTSSYIRLPFVGTGNVNGIMGTASGGEFGVKLGLRTHAYSVNATANVEIGGNKVASIKLEMEVGGFLSLTEARSRTTNAIPAVGGFCHTEWIIVPSDITNDYESVYLTAANLSDAGDISIDVCRIVVTDLGLYVP